MAKPASEGGASKRRGLSGGKPRARSFRYSESSKPLSRVPRDDRTLKRSGPTVEIIRPAWNGQTGTTFRPLPMFCAEDPDSFDPTRLSTDAYDFGDWTRGLPSVKYVGIDQKFTFILYDPRRVQNEGYNPREENPYNVLYNAITAAVEEGEAVIDGKDVITGKWGALTVDGPKKAFNAPTKLHFYQGFLYEHNGDTFIKEGLPKGARDGDLPQIIEVSKTGGDALAAALNKLRPGYKGDTGIENQAAMYLQGDIVDLANGKFITFYNPDKHDVMGDESEEDDEKEEGGREFKGWKTALSDKFSYVHKRATKEVDPDISDLEARVRDQIVWWDDLLYIPPDEEICMWLASAFRSLPNLLRFGWADHPEFFTDEVKGILANRVQGPGAEVPTDEEEDTPPPKRGASKSSALPVDDEEEDDDDNDEEGEEVGEGVAEDGDDDAVGSNDDTEHVVASGGADEEGEVDDDEEDEFEEDEYDEDDEDEADAEEEAEAEEEAVEEAQDEADVRASKRGQGRVAPKRTPVPKQKSPRKK